MVLVVSSAKMLSLIEGTSKQGIVSKFHFWYYSWVPNKRPPPTPLIKIWITPPPPPPRRLFIIPNIFSIIEIDDLNTNIPISKFQ